MKINGRQSNHEGSGSFFDHKHNETEIENGDIGVGDALKSLSSNVSEPETRVKKGMVLILNESNKSQVFNSRTIKGIWDSLQRVLVNQEDNDIIFLDEQQKKAFENDCYHYVETENKNNFNVSSEQLKLLSDINPKDYTCVYVPKVSKNETSLIHEKNQAEKIVDLLCEMKITENISEIRLLNASVGQFSLSIPSVMVKKKNKYLKERKKKKKIHFPDDECSGELNIPNNSSYFIYKVIEALSSRGKFHVKVDEYVQPITFTRRKELENGLCSCGGVIYNNHDNDDLELERLALKF